MREKTHARCEVSVSGVFVFCFFFCVCGSGGWQSPASVNTMMICMKSGIGRDAAEKNKTSTLHTHTHTHIVDAKSQTKSFGMSQNQQRRTQTAARPGRSSDDSFVWKLHSEPIRFCFIWFRFSAAFAVSSLVLFSRGRNVNSSRLHSLSSAACAQFYQIKKMLQDVIVMFLRDLLHVMAHAHTHTHRVLGRMKKSHQTKINARAWRQPSTGRGQPQKINNLHSTAEKCNLFSMTVKLKIKARKKWSANARCTRRNEMSQREIHGGAKKKKNAKIWMRSCPAHLFTYSIWLLSLAVFAARTFHCNLFVLFFGCCLH